MLSKLWNVYRTLIFLRKHIVVFYSTMFLKLHSKCFFKHLTIKLSSHWSIPNLQNENKVIITDDGKASEFLSINSKKLLQLIIAN